MPPSRNTPPIPNGSLGKQLLSSPSFTEFSQTKRFAFSKPLNPQDSDKTTPALSLHDFTREAWHVLEPGRTFLDNWHIGVIAEHLEACSRGEITRLVINMPPRHMKSILVSVMWFAWTWTFQPSSRWLYASYAQTLATRDSRKCRQLIQSPWYRERFGDHITLVGDQNQKMRFENDRTGYRIATAVDALGTGEGGEYLICDDPHNVKEAESTLKREGALDWWFGTMSTRANDEATVRRVIVAQRVHHNDLSGEVIARELGYEHLTIPARYEADHVKLTSLQRERPDLRDPRTTEGELLHAARMNEAQLTALAKELGTYNAAGQLQQRPTPKTGGVFTAAGLPTRDANGRAHVEPMGALPRIRFWDLGGTDSKRGDSSAGLLMTKHDGRYAVCDVERGQWSPNERNARILATAERDKQRYGNVRTIIERGVGLAVEVTDNIVRLLAGYRVEVRAAKGDKESRADPLSDQCAGGNVYLVEAAWNADFIDECLRFPKVDHDDQVDAFSGAFAELAIEKKAWIDI